MVDALKRSRLAHYVRENKVTRVPRQHIYLDSEATRKVVGNGEVQTFRCAVTAYDRKTRDGVGWRERTWGEHLSPDELWRWVDERTTPRARTVLVAHNLAYDLRICRAFECLPALGWQLKAIRLGDRSSWVSWRRDGRTLVMVDSMSWVPLPLDVIGELCEIPKLALPDWEDDPEAWFARCRRDVEILATAWRKCLAYIQRHDMGNWKPTGAGQSWAAYRHRFMAHHLFVHDDPDARAMERAAGHTGRCEAWVHGRLAGGPFTEWDYVCAYAHIGADSDVPVKLVGQLTRPTLLQVTRASCRTVLLAEVTVTTDRPVVPFHGDGGYCWPVGTFRTTLWGNELGLALENGAHIDVERAWQYRRAPALSDFCGYVLGALKGCTGELDPIVRELLKLWSRALIGRMGARWSTWQEYGRAPSHDVSLSVCRDVGADERFELLHLGNQLLRCTEVAESPDAMVAIMSWVMAEARVRLWRTMELAGLGNVLYVDTDSLIVNPAGHANLQRARVPNLRVKSTMRGLTVLGPRQLVAEGRVRAAGVPRTAVEVEPGVWEGDVWRGLTRSLETGESDRVSIARRRFRLRGTDNRREHLPGGATAPFELDGGMLATG